MDPVVNATEYPAVTADRSGPAATGEPIVEQASVPGEESMTPSSKGRKFIADKNANFIISAQFSARYDDNLFLSDTDTVSDTIYALSPGIAFQFGRNSLSSGSLSYVESFTRYANKTAPNANLGSGTADFSYDDGNVTLRAAANFQQIYQNNRNTAAASGDLVIRQDVVGLDTNIEGHFTPKSSFSTGIIYNKVSYKSAELVDNQDYSVPLKIYYSITPKVSLSSGVDFRRTETDVPGSVGKERYYNLGARGEFTPKVSGEFSVGYRSRKSENNANQNLLSFNGNFAYELTVKTNASLNFSRDFSTDAFGKSLKNTTFSLLLSTNPNPQWQFSTGLTFQAVDYGLISYSSGTQTLSANRDDRYWVGNIQATYLFSNSISAAINYTFRKNLSSIPVLPGATFKDNLLNLTINWKY